MEQSQPAVRHNLTNPEVATWFSAIVNEFPETVLLIGMDSHIIYANDAWLELRNAGLDCQSSDVREFFDEEEQRVHAERMRLVAERTEDDRSFEETYAIDSGTHHRSNLVTAWFSDGVPFVVSVVGRDRTAQHQRELQLLASHQRLAEVTKDLTDFATAAAHDLQEPLRRILVFGSRLRLSFVQSGREEDQSFLDRMIANAESMRGLIADLQTLAVSTSPQEVEPAVDLQRLASQCVRSFEDDLGTTSKVRIENLPVVRGDSRQLKLLFHHLVANAIDFKSPDRRLELSITANTGQTKDPLWQMRGTVISVTDNGIGFEPRYADRVFSMFQQLESAANSQASGSGIGLTVCRHIVRSHGGEISVRSTPGEGTTFEIWIPEAEADHAVDAAA